ncbi:hypothetical protein PGT21_002964 [Puccinia graminis f. sp. tritici]|uniref:Uncharacterized protein n=1 Tax=Puccinia graminis f. sp. tritici TaxID=56615 RepID=A0A5B0LLX3_PUCGR|nr:hypothetical protein PGT21_002964 [Puccinia graminis f. sp. tritici]KAA1079973.1 hypothetical protein PGTUg99_015882 [Puccinia graminis f. sp. tritici]
MSDSTRAPVLTPTLFPAGLTPHVQAEQHSQSDDFSPLKQYNGAIYKWTQQLLQHTQRANPEIADKSSVTKQDKSDTITANPSSNKFA